MLDKFNKLPEEFNIIQNEEYIDKFIGLLDNCYNKIYLDNFSITIGNDDELCYLAFYKKTPFIIPDKFISKLSGGYYRKYMKYKIKNNIFI